MSDTDVTSLGVTATLLTEPSMHILGINPYAANVSKLESHRIFTGFVGFARQVKGQTLRFLYVAIFVSGSSNLLLKSASIMSGRVEWAKCNLDGVIQLSGESMQPFIIKVTISGQRRVKTADKPQIVFQFQDQQSKNECECRTPVFRFTCYTEPVQLRDFDVFISTQIYPEEQEKELKRDSKTLNPGLRLKNTSPAYDALHVYGDQMKTRTLNIATWDQGTPISSIKIRPQKNEYSFRPYALLGKFIAHKKNIEINNAILDNVYSNLAAFHASEWCNLICWVPPNGSVLPTDETCDIPPIPSSPPVESSTQGLRRPSEESQYDYNPKRPCLSPWSVQIILSLCSLLIVVLVMSLGVWSPSATRSSGPSSIVHSVGTEQAMAYTRDYLNFNLGFTSIYLNQTAASLNNSKEKRQPTDQSTRIRIHDLESAKKNLSAIPGPVTSNTFKAVEKSTWKAEIYNGNQNKMFSYELTSDIQTGEAFLVSYPIEEEKEQIFAEYQEENQTQLQRDQEYRRDNPFVSEVEKYALFVYGVLDGPELCTWVGIHFDEQFMFFVKTKQELHHHNLSKSETATRLSFHYHRHRTARVDRYLKVKSDHDETVVYFIFRVTEIDRSWTVYKAEARFISDTKHFLLLHFETDYQHCPTPAALACNTANLPPLDVPPLKCLF